MSRTSRASRSGSPSQESTYGTPNGANRRLDALEATQTRVLGLLERIESRLELIDPVPGMENPLKSRLSLSGNSRKSIESLHGILPTTPAPSRMKDEGSEEPSLKAEAKADFTVTTPTVFEFKEITYLSLHMIKQLEHELEVYRTRPQNRSQNIYLFSDKYMSLNFRNWFCDRLSDRFQDGDVEVADEDKLKTYDDQVMIQFFKLALKPKDARESIDLISKIVDTELSRHKDKLKTYAWSQVVTWTNAIQKVFQILEYYLANIQSDTDKLNPPPMRKDNMLKLKGLNELLTEKLYPTDIGVAMNETFQELKLLEKHSKGFSSLTQYMFASRKVFASFVESYRKHEVFIKAAHKHNQKSKTKETFGLITSQLSSLTTKQQEELSQQVLHSESYDEETNKELLSDITSLCSLSDTIMQERLNALEKEGQTLDKICCYRNMNGGRCKEVNCPYSHSLEDQALYYKLKLNKVEQDIAAKGQKLHAVETSLDSDNHEAT